MLHLRGINNIALCENKYNLDNSLQINNMNSNYYLPNEFRIKAAEIIIKSNFSLAHLNIRTMTNKFDHFKGPPASGITRFLYVLSIILTFRFHAKRSPGGEGGYRNPSREFMRICEFGQFWGADFKIRCYMGQ
jgi:hypothetical protein